MSEVQREALDESFIQAVLATQSISQDSLENLFKYLGGSGDIDSQVTRCNLKLDTANLRLQKIRNDQKNGEWYYVLVSTKDIPEFTESNENPAQTLSMSRTLALYLQKLLDQIFGNVELGIEESKLPSDMRKPQDIKNLNRLEIDGWIEKSGTGLITITSRTLLELEPFLKERYGGRTLMPCLGCKKWVLKGTKCSNNRCNAHLHRWCYDDYFAATGGQIGKCPHCAECI